LAQEDHPPEIGQHWKYRDWMSCGKWEMERNPAFADWLVRTVSRLEKLVDECRIQAELADQEEVQSRQQLAHLTKEWEAFQNLHFTPIHHKDYLGEQPEVEEQERISHSYSQGESETVSYSRMGTSHGYGTSKSYSTSHSTADVQWYDLVDELDQTHAQRQDEIANEIASQPDYIARVKIKDENDELVEYTTRTLKPEPGLRGRALEERLLQIKETMIGQNIIRPKHVIDEEIKKRQQALRQPMLEPPHKQRTLPPPEDEPPITRRR